MGLEPGHMSSIRRIEAGMPSYHADMTLANTPFELHPDRLVKLEMEADFVGKDALKRIRAKDIEQRLVGPEIEGGPFAGTNDFFRPIMKAGRQVGTVTSAVYSPRLEKNIALGMPSVEHAQIGTEPTVQTLGETRGGVVVPIPFHDPKTVLAVVS